MDQDQDSLKSQRYILLLEDNEPVVTMLSAIINEAFSPEFELLVATRIEDAQTLALDHQAELFILDINLPDGNGLDFLCDLRTTHPDARVLMMTAAPLPEYREEASRLGVIHFLSKPFDLELFRNTVRSLLYPQAHNNNSFRGTLQNLHLTDVIQIKCISGATSALEFTSPDGDKGIIYFYQGRIVHACANGVEGIQAFNIILTWRGGSFSEQVAVGEIPKSIDCDWQTLLMEAVRRADELGSSYLQQEA